MGTWGIAPMLDSMHPYQRYSKETTSKSTQKHQKSLKMTKNTPKMTKNAQK
jgi:hypothetical protein